MRWQNQRTRLAQPQAPFDRDAALAQHLYLPDQRVRRQHHAVTDETGDAFVQDARRDQVQDRLRAADDQGVPGVVAALETHHRAGTLGEEVDHLALALVAPLGTDHDDRFRHSTLSGAWAESYA